MRATFHPNLELVQHHVDNHKGLTERCNNLKPRERDSIQNCVELKEFLTRAINFLQKPHGHPYSEQVAHYLMGKVDYLPDGLDAPFREIPKPIKTLLHDLLRVHRHQWLGKREASEKTINKLQFLNNQLFHYDASLASWQDSAPPGEEEARKTAVHKIYTAMYMGSTHLSLSHLDLTSIPPLPADLVNNLKDLDLFENRLTSLVGLPEQMPNLESLTLRDNELTSLLGLPSELNHLRYLSLDKNRLTSLVALPEQMPKLEHLSLEKNQLASLVGMPSHLHSLKELSLDENELTSLIGMPFHLDSLKELSLNKNKLTSLIGLSSHLPTLGHLHIQDNQLTSLAGMPSELNHLYRLRLGQNKLTSLEGMPRHLNNLWQLSLDHNDLTSLASMPLEMNALTELNLQHNRLISLDGVPASVLQRPVRIRAQSNPFSSETIQAINQLENGADIQFDMAAHEQARPVRAPALRALDEGESVITLENELKKWFADMDTDPWMSHDAVDKANLATLLKRLHTSAAFQGVDRSDSMAELKEILGCMQEDRLFREYCFTLAHGASANCSDNVQAIFDEMRMQLANPVTKKDGALDTVVQFYVGREKASLIADYVGTLRGGDPLESVMLLQHELSADLALPIRFKAINYAPTAIVFNDLPGHKQRALQFVNERFDPERVTRKMLEEAPAVDFLKRTYGPTFTAHQLLWTDALEQAGLDQAEKTEVPAHNPKLHAARQSVLGDGSRFKALQQEDELQALKEVATHAMENPAMSAQDRTQFEIGKLTADRDWCVYIGRSDVQEEVIARFNLGESTRNWSVHEWTLEVLASAMETI